MSAFVNGLFGSLTANEEWRKRAVWEKGRIIPGLDPNVWREDDYGFRIKYDDYGNRNSTHGWEQDHYPIPIALGGLDTIDNLRPLRCSVNAMMGGILSNALGK